MDDDLEAPAAADATVLEHLRAENAALSAQLNTYKNVIAAADIRIADMRAHANVTLSEENDALISRAERAEAERDALRQAIIEARAALAAYRG